jgi:predicted enzyme related to lactoylglutathione lyase
MAERTSFPHGTFSWVELATTDQDAAKGFYSRLFGWDYDDSPVGDGVVYSMAKLQDKYVAAIAPQREEERAQGIPPHWNSYVTVEDVDAVAGRVGELGGQLIVPAFDVMDVGRMAVLADPTGAVLCLWQPGRHPGAGLVNAPGAFCWNEINTRDPQAAQEFYAALFGWEFEPSESTGGAYWTIRNGGRWNGGIRQMGDEFPPEVPAHWLVYFAVESVTDTVDQASAAGAHVMLPRMDIDRGSIGVLADPQGASFGLYEGVLED